MADKTIYLNPGETLEIRFVDEDEPKTAKSWADHFRPAKLLLRCWPGQIAPADPATRIERGADAWK